MYIYSKENKSMSPDPFARKLVERMRQALMIDPI